MALLAFGWAKPTGPKNPVPEPDTDECAFEDDDCAIDDSEDLDIPSPSPKFQRMENVWTSPPRPTMRGAHKTAPINIDFDKHMIDLAARRRATKHDPSYAYDATIEAIQQHIDVFGNTKHVRRLYGHLPEIRSYKLNQDEDEAMAICKASHYDDRPLGRVSKEWDYPTGYVQMSEKRRAVRQMVGLVPESSQQLSGTHHPANHLGPEARACIRNMLVNGNYKPCHLQTVLYRAMRLEDVDNMIRRQKVHRTHQKTQAMDQPQDQSPPRTPVTNTATVLSRQTGLRRDDGDENYITESGTPSPRTIPANNASSASSAINTRQTENVNTVSLASPRYHPLNLPKQPTLSLVSQQLAGLRSSGGVSLSATTAITDTSKTEQTDTNRESVNILQGLPSPTPHSYPSREPCKDCMETARQPVTILQGLQSPLQHLSVPTSSYSNDENITGQPVAILQGLPSPAPALSHSMSSYSPPSPRHERLSLSGRGWTSPPRQASLSQSSATASPQRDNQSSADEQYNSGGDTPISSPIQASPEPPQPLAKQQKQQKRQPQQGWEMPMQHRPRFQWEPSYRVCATVAALMEAKIMPAGLKSKRKNTEAQKPEAQKLELTPQVPERHVHFATLPRREDFLDNTEPVSKKKENQ